MRCGPYCHAADGGRDTNGLARGPKMTEGGRDFSSSRPSEVSIRPEYRHCDYELCKAPAAPCLLLVWHLHLALLQSIGSIARKSLRVSIPYRPAAGDCIPTGGGRKTHREVTLRSGRTFSNSSVGGEVKSCGRNGGGAADASC